MQVLESKASKEMQNFWITFKPVQTEDWFAPSNVRILQWLLVRKKERKEHNLVTLKDWNTLPLRIYIVIVQH